jgi:hypothetical protein
MEYLFISIKNNSSIKDIKIFINKNDAIQESINNPSNRVEIFNKLNNLYIPTYNYIRNGEYVNTTNLE